MYMLLVSAVPSVSAIGIVVVHYVMAKAANFCWSLSLIWLTSSLSSVLVAAAAAASAVVVVAIAVAVVLW